MKKLLLSLFIVVLAVTACSPHAPELAQNRSQWQTQDIHHYRFQLDIVCFCAYREQMPLIIEVENGQVICIAAANGSDITNAREFFTQSDTIEKIFELIESAAKEAEELTVTYNTDYGYPETIYIDYAKELADDEIWYTISQFESLN